MVLTELKLFLKELWLDKHARFATYGLGLVLALWALQTIIAA